MKRSAIVLALLLGSAATADAQLFPRLYAARQAFRQRRAALVEVTPATSPVGSVAHQVRHSDPGAGASDALAIVNQKRAARGLRAIAHDPAMAAAAIKEASHQAAAGHTGHCHPMNKAGVKSGTGWASGGNLPGRFTSCYLYDRKITRGGAAIAYSADGRQAHYALMAM